LEAPAAVPGGGIIAAGPRRYLLAMVYKTRLCGSSLGFGDCCDMSIGKI
jgi:hypothetical protein